MNEFLLNFWTELLVAIVLAIATGLLAKYRRSILVSLLRLFYKELRDIGLVMVYPTWEDAIPRISKSILASNNLCMLGNRGTDWIGTNTSALSQVVRQQAVSGLRLRSILLSSDAPWLNSKWASDHGRPSIDFLREEFNASHKVFESFIDLLPRLRGESGVRYHMDDPCWRMIITERSLFISSYASSGKARNSPVLEFDGPNKGFYSASLRYFNFLWERRGGAPKYVSDIDMYEGHFSDFEKSAGAVVFSSFNSTIYVLVLKREDGSITFPKGHIETGEFIESTILREIEEETGIARVHLSIKDKIGWYPNPIEVRSGKRIFKMVHYFLVHFDGPKDIKLSTEEIHSGVSWLQIDSVGANRFAYKHLRQVVDRASKLIFESS